MQDSYYIIAGEAQHEIKIKGSRFIGECGPATTVEAAQAFLETIRKREHAANHHCYAYTVGVFDNTEFKYSDDGEPSGTAGRPIYDVITGRELTNTIVVVTRYFGGTKLGTGGLVRAYSQAAIETVEAAGRKQKFLKSRIEVGIDFSLYDMLMKTMQKYEARQVDAEFTDSVRVVIEVRDSRIDALRDEIVQLSSGKATIENAKGE